MTPETFGRRSVLGLAAGMALAATVRPSAGQAATSPWTKEGFVRRPGMRIHYASLGEGPPVILLHKLGGWIADWRYIAPALGTRHRVIVIDSPGHGDSAVEGPIPYLLSLPES